MSEAVGRRRFLLAALAGALATQGCRLTGELRGGRSGLADWLTGPGFDPAASARIGHAYLAAYPQDRDPGQLLDALERAVAKHAASPAETFDALDHTVRSEYASGDYVQVAGWILSRSEARLYALITLSAEPSRRSGGSPATATGPFRG